MMVPVDIVRAKVIPQKHASKQLSLSLSFFLSLVSELDLDGDGYLDETEIQKACKDSGYSSNYDEIRATLKQVRTSATSKIDTEEFIEVCIQEGGVRAQGGWVDKFWREKK